MLPAGRNTANFMRRTALVVPLLAGIATGPVVAQGLPPSQPDAVPDPSAVPVSPAPEPGPLKVLSWNVATSPYAIAMRKIKSAAPSWRTSFGAERRTISPPAAPQAVDFDFDVVLLQGVINPRALRRLFPARRWRLILSPKAMASLPKGSVFTAPVSTTEVEAVAVRYRRGLRIATRTDVASNADPGAMGEAAPPGLAVKVLDRGRTLWFASVDLAASCTEADMPCSAWQQMTKWRLQQRESGDNAILGGRLSLDGKIEACAAMTIEADLAGAGLPSRAKGERSELLGCSAQLTID